MTKLQRYNGLDSIATLQLWQVMKEQFAAHPEALETYRISKALQAPILYMMLRGILVNKETIDELREKFTEECKFLESRMDIITRSLGMGVVNFGSPVQVLWLIESFGAKVPVKFVKGKPSKSANAENLEQIAKADPELAPICNIILAWRNRKKMLDVLGPTLANKDGRVHCTYKIGGTVTGRLSSGADMFANKRLKLKSGMNMQNIKQDEDESKTGHASIRSMFVADDGYKSFNIDLERADSWAVALEVFKATGDRKYLDACSAGDMHTYVSKLVWPDLGWTGDEEADTKIAKQYFYRQHSYRFMSKKLQHGGNYLGKPRTLAIQMKIPVALAQAGHDSYFGEFPAIPTWHAIKKKELQTTGSLTNLFGRKRNFHGRLDADSTLREAIAYLGQSVTAEVINRAFLRLWAIQCQMPWYDLQLLAQVHDSMFGQYLAQFDQAEVIPLLTHVMQIPITVTSPQGKTITVCIPLEASTGWNWAGHSPANPDGQIKFKPGKLDDRQRQRPAPQTQLRLMDRRLSSLY